MGALIYSQLVRSTSDNLGPAIGIWNRAILWDSALKLWDMTRTTGSVRTELTCRTQLMLQNWLVRHILCQKYSMWQEKKAAFFLDITHFLSCFMVFRNVYFWCSIIYQCITIRIVLSQSFPPQSHKNMLFYFSLVLHYYCLHLGFSFIFLQSTFIYSTKLGNLWIVLN